ncbi:ADP-ribosyltransferase, partial [Streptomyces sp. NPDC091299]|uniref:ADP-ribosyltransferase n=1 Tax=Streptomyces sp. NPDC091299 TaxID=3155302 RepID=UPI0034281CB0
AKGAGAGLSKIGDISKALKGVGNIEIPKLPDGSVHLPDGRLLDTDGNLIGHDGTIDTTPAPHEVVPGIPADWTIQEPALSGVRAGDGVPDGIHGHAPSGTFDGPPATYDHAPPTAPHGHAPAPSTFDHTSTATPHGHAPAAFEHTPTATPHDAPAATPHPGAGHDLPHGSGHDTPNGHGDDGAHDSGHDQHDGAAHDGSDHTDDVPGHGDDAAHPADHAGDGHANPHGGTDASLAHGAGKEFKYTPHVSAEAFEKLSDAEKHSVAAAEVSKGTVPFPDDYDAVVYGRGHWNDYVDNLDPSAKQALKDYTGDSFPSYKDMNGYLRGSEGYGPRPEVLHDIQEMDRVMSTRPLPEDAMVVRGTGIGHLDIDSPFDMEGRVFEEDGYLSTSLGNHPVPSFAGKEAIYHLRVPKNTPALWLEKVSHYGVEERELLLGRGAKYRVTRVFVDEVGKVQVYGEVLPR